MLQLNFHYYENLNFHNKFVVNYLGTWTSGWNKFCFEWRTDFKDGALLQKEQFADLFQVKYQKNLSLTGTNLSQKKMLSQLTELN